MLIPSQLTSVRGNLPNLIAIVDLTDDDVMRPPIALDAFVLMRLPVLPDEGLLRNPDWSIAVATMRRRAIIGGGARRLCSCAPCSSIPG